jgi:hypothetical protein
LHKDILPTHPYRSQNPARSAEHSVYTAVERRMEDKYLQRGIAAIFIGMVALWITAAIVAVMYWMPS